MTVLRLPAPREGNPLIEFRNVSRMFAKRNERSRSMQELFIRLLRGKRPPQDVFWPLRDVTLSLQAGDCVGVIGPNGSGKSTLLKLATGILEPTDGDMIVAGRLSSLLELGAGFQLDLTGRENIYLNGSIYGLSRAQITERMDRIIDYAELGEFIDTPVKHYSSGMYVRLAFAVAIHTEPDLLLVDEVLAVGDIAFQRKCLNSIFEFRKKGGTLLLVSHDLSAVQSICTRVVWLEDGLIQAEGNPTDVIIQYQKHVTAQEDAKIEAAARAGVPREADQESRWGEGKLKITDVVLCGADGTPTHNFMTGDAMQIRMYYTSEKRIKRPVFGLAIHHQNGTNVFGPNTKFGRVDIPFVEGSGIISFTVAELPLLEGGYTVSVAAVNFEDTLTFDYHDRAYTFQVFGGEHVGGYGIVEVKGEWQFQPMETVEEETHETSVQQAL